jgi:hypothetical protein
VKLRGFPGSSKWSKIGPTYPPEGGNGDNEDRLVANEARHVEVPRALGPLVHPTVRKEAPLEAANCAERFPARVELPPRELEVWEYWRMAGWQELCEKSQPVKR